MPAIAYATNGYNNTTLKPKGMPTGSWTRVLTTLNATDGEANYVIYDYKARPIKTFNRNYLGGYTQVDTNLDFAGKIIYTETRHKRVIGDTELYVRDDYSYTDQDRMLTHLHKVGVNGAQQLIAQNSYDELGQLISKKVGNTVAVPLQKIDYSYNVRGWLTDINKTGWNDPNNVAPLNIAGEPNDLFAFRINYDQKVDAAGYAGKALFNGNIAETYWRTSGDNVLRKYGYFYDDLNRLRNSVYQKPQTSAVVTNMYNESMTYDKNGNIKTLQRNGDFDAQVLPVQIDNLIYTYKTNSGVETNQLAKVEEDVTSNSTLGFKNGNAIGDDYSYDANGNLLQDKNKSTLVSSGVYAALSNIKYNHLNLPTEVFFAATKKINYIYNAVGVKLKKIVTSGASTITTDYLDGYQYLKTSTAAVALQYFPHSEGYVNFDLGVYKYVFNYTDHLGNIRLSYTRNDVTGLPVAMEENHYYPFGLKHTNYNVNVMKFRGATVVAASTGNVYKYKYNGKELQDELGLNWYDYGARNYDASLGRWMNIDPLAEVSPDWTPYRYCYNNPVKLTDPTGMLEGDYFTEEGGYIGNDGIDDKKVYIVKKGDFQDIGGGKNAIFKKTELTDARGNAVNINTFTHLAATLYAEGSSTSSEASGIFSVLKNRANADGTSIMEQASVDKGVYGASDVELSKYSSVNASTSMKENANKAVIIGLKTSTDYSNGGYFWDGKDFNGSNAIHGGYDERYTPGYLFTNSSQDLWGQGSNKVPGDVGRGAWNYKYKSTGSAGNTTFSTLTYQYRISQFINVDGSSRISNWKGNKPL